MQRAKHPVRLVETKPCGYYSILFLLFKWEIRENGVKVNIPSYQVKVGDIIEVRPNKKAKKLFNDLSDRMKNHTVMSWLHREEDTKGKIVSMPQGEDLKEVYDPKLIVEFYSMR